MSTTPFPTINPSGTNMFPGASSGTPVMATGTGGPGNYGFGNGMNPIPPNMPGAPGMPGSSTGAPVTGALPTGPGGAAPGIAGFNTSEQQSLQNTLAGTFHTGYGTYLEQLLNSQGGYNSALTAQNVQDTIAAMQTNINRGSGTLNTQLAQQGVSPSSSVSALENAFYQSDAVTKENAIAAQDYFNMWSSAMGNEFGLAESLAGPIAGEKAGESTMAKLQGIGNFIGAVTGGSSYSSSSGPGGDTSSWTIG